MHLCKMRGHFICIIVCRCVRGASAKFGEVAFGRRLDFVSLCIRDILLCVPFRG